MKTCEFEWIDAINRDGLDNSMWGLCGSSVNSREFYGVGDEDLPPHLYVYGEDGDTYSPYLGKMLRWKYDRKLYLDETHFIAFFWLSDGE